MIYIYLDIMKYISVDHQHKDDREYWDICEHLFNRKNINN